MNTLAKWALADYHSMIAAGILQDRQVELLGGEIHDMTPEGPLHTFYGGSLADFFRQNLGNRALVREAHPVTLANSEPEPDIAIVRGEWANYRLRHPTAEEIFLVVEISESTLAKDLDRKKAIYAAAGIVEYWVLNLLKLQLIVFRHPQAQDYLSRQEFKEGEIAPVMFPDVKISLTQLFRQALL